MTYLKWQEQTTHNLQTDEETNAYFLLLTIYVPELATLDFSFMLLLQGLNIQPYADESSR